MVKQITIWDIPASVKEANGITFDHEGNQYRLVKDGVHINIPSDAQMYHYEGTDITNIEFPFADITLWDSVACPPYITIYPEALRGWIQVGGV